MTSKAIITRIRKIITAITEDRIPSTIKSDAYIPSAFQSISKITAGIDLRDLIYFNYEKTGYIRCNYLI